MNRIIAIAFLAIRSAVRSRLFISLMVVLALTVSVLPITIKGDGTLTGQITILLRYTLGFVAVILGLATLWTSCGAIAQEVEEKQIHLIVVKPVHSFEIWLGKWLGLVIMNAVLLCMAGTAVYVIVRWSTGPSCITEEERSVLQRNVLTGRRLVLSRPESESALDRYIHEQLERMTAEGAVLEDAAHDAAYTLVREQVLTRQAAVSPGASKRWLFDLPERIHLPVSGKSEVVLSFRFRFSIPGMERLPVAGTWTVGTEKQPDLFTRRIDGYFAGPHQFSVPVSRLRLNQPLVVEFTNDAADSSRTVILDPERNIELLIPESGFEMNLVRALLIILCQVALLAAIGLAASTVFSFPVAVFTSFAVLAMALMTHYFAFASVPGHVCLHDHHGDSEQASSFAKEVSEYGVRGLGKVVEPAMRFGPLVLLSNGMLVSWRLVGEALAILVIIYSGVFGLLGGWFLKRRELGLPV